MAESSTCVRARDGGGEKERERMEGRSDISHVACSHIDAEGYTHTCVQARWGVGRRGVGVWGGVGGAG